MRSQHICAHRTERTACPKTETHSRLEGQGVSTLPAHDARLPPAFQKSGRIVIVTDTAGVSQARLTRKLVHNSPTRTPYLPVSLSRTLSERMQNAEVFEQEHHGNGADPNERQGLFTAHHRAHSIDPRFGTEVHADELAS